MKPFFHLYRVICLFLLTILGSPTSFAAPEQTEVSLKVGRADALSVVSKFKMEKIEREDRYFDFYRDGQFQLSKENAPFKIRLMATDQKPPKLQTSKLTRSLDFECNQLKLHTQTKTVYETEDKDKQGHKEGALTVLSHLHSNMLANIDSLNRQAYSATKESLEEEYKNLKFKIKDQLEELNIEQGFVASYGSSKVKYKVDMAGASGQKIELSVTFSKNYCSKSCMDDDYTIELQKSDDSTDLEFSEGACYIINSLNLEDIRPTPEVNQTLEASLKNHILLN
ncbi:MAG: hypothetical protein WCI18_09755 [Pseudomonadota bacterium]